MAAIASASTSWACLRAVMSENEVITAVGLVLPASKIGSELTDTHRMRSRMPRSPITTLRCGAPVSSVTIAGNWRTRSGRPSSVMASQRGPLEWG